MNLIAHRGLHSKNTKENTLAAILLANRNNKLSGVELDVRLTRDDEVVVIHDDCIDRVSNGKGKVREMSLSRLKHFNYGTWIKKTTISTLEEVLSKLISSSLVIIELKDEDIKNNILVKKVLEIIEKYPNLNIWLKSFSKEIVNKLKEFSKYPVGILINKDNRELLDMDVDFYSISQKIIDKNIVNELANRNKTIMIWTVNTKEDMNVLNDKIGDQLNNIYIISDNPLKL